MRKSKRGRKKRICKGNCKKQLTFRLWCSILDKLTWGALFLSDEPEKLNHWEEKKLDKSRTAQYNKQVRFERKQLGFDLCKLRFAKKNEKRCWQTKQLVIIYISCPRERRARACTLQIKQRETTHKAPDKIFLNLDAFGNERKPSQFLIA